MLLFMITLSWGKASIIIMPWKWIFLIGINNSLENYAFI